MAAKGRSASPIEAEELRSELARALAGDREALEVIVEGLTPVIHARVARALLRDDRSTGGVRQVVEDLVQQVYVDLFEDDAKVLRDWHPERGLSLQNFVGLVAERRVYSTLRRTRRNPWTEEPGEAPLFERPATAPGPERRAGSRQRLRRMLEGLRAELSPLGWRVFELLFLRELPVSDVGFETGLSRDAVYAWRSRLRRLARRLAAEEGMPETTGARRS